MHFVELWTYLHDVFSAIRDASSETQADAVSRLFLFLQDRQDHLYPSVLSCQARETLHWYLVELLPVQGYEDEDRHIIAEEYQTLINQMFSSEETVKHLEETFCRILCRLKKGTYPDVCAVAEDVLNMFNGFSGEDVILHDLQGIGHRFGQHYNELKNGTDCLSQYPLNSKIRCSDDDRNDDRHHLQSGPLQKQFASLQKTFNAVHVSQFFKELLDTLGKPLFERCSNIFCIPSFRAKHCW